MTQSIFDHPLVTERYFYPRRETFENPYWVESGDARLACYYHHKFPNAKTVIFFHGNGEIVSDYIDLYVPTFDQMGFNILLAEYRGYGMSTGTPALATMLDDVSPIIKAVNLPPEQLILFGRSIGSLYALHGIYLFPRISGLIIESGIANILERVLLRVHPSEFTISMEKLEEEVKKTFNHQQKLAGYKGASLIIHAKHDSLVNVSHGRQLHDWAPEPKKLIIFDKGDHNDILMANAQDYFLSIYRFISAL